MAWGIEQSHLFLIGKNFTKLISLPKDSTSEKKIGAYRKALRFGNLGLANSLSFEFYHLYFNEVESVLRGHSIEKTVWVTEGHWALFPLETLVVQNTKKTLYWNLKFENAYAQSILLWAENQKKAKGIFPKKQNI